MARYCSLARYKRYIDSLKNVKEFGSTNLKYLQNLLTYKSQKSIWKDIVAQITENNSRLNNLTKTVIAAHQEDKTNPSRTKQIRTKLLKKEIQRVYTNLQKKCVPNQNIIWSSAAVAGVGSNLETTTTVNSPQDVVLDPLPEPPVIPETPQIFDGAEEIVNQLNALGEPTFASLGLGGYTPVGIAQHCFEYLHVTLGVEWWAAIAIGTLIIRTLLFPLVVIAQRNAAKMNNYLPQMQLLQLKITEARQTGNHMEVARYSQELMIFMKEKNLNPLKNMIVPLAQMPIFISFFMALRQMSNVPVESLRTGGMFWFTDLTLPDQYFILPLITSATLYATIELGTDTAKLSSQNLQLMKYVLRGLPIIILPFIVNFPGAILCYWVSTNFISLVQVGFLKIPKVRVFFNIEQLQKIDPGKLPVKTKGFREGLKDSWTNIKLTKELEERSRLDELQFQRAGKGPIIKTYKYDPTKQVKPPVSAKER